MTMPDFTSHFFIVFTVKVHTFSVPFLPGFTAFCLPSFFGSQRQSYDFFLIPQMPVEFLFLPAPLGGQE